MALNVDLLVSTGNDAAASYFDILIAGPPAVGDFTLTNIRIQSASIPSSGHPTYERWYKSQKIVLASAQEEIDKTLTFTYTIDNNYLEYKKFKAWKNLVVDSTTGAVLPLTPGVNMGIITIFGQNTSELPVQPWIFDGARVTSIGEVSFDRNSGEGIQTDVTFAFNKLLDSA